MKKRSKEFATYSDNNYDYNEQFIKLVNLHKEVFGNIVNKIILVVEVILLSIISGMIYFNYDFLIALVFVFAILISYVINASIYQESIDLEDHDSILMISKIYSDYKKGNLNIQIILLDVLSLCICYKVLFWHPFSTFVVCLFYLSFLLNHLGMHLYIRSFKFMLNNELLKKDKSIEYLIEEIEYSIEKYKRLEEINH